MIEKLLVVAEYLRDKRVIEGFDIETSYEAIY